MKKTFLVMLVLVFALGTALYAGGSELKVKFDKGLKLTSKDKAFALKIGGRIMSDWAFFSADEDIEEIAGPMKDGGEFRRARLYVSGTIYDKVEFKAQYDFAGGDADFKDVYIGIKKIAGGAGLRVGHFKEPFSLEELTSSKYITFMERSLPIEALGVPSRNTGFALHQASNRLSWGFGLFKDSDGYGTPEDNVYESAWAFTGRLAGTVWYDKDNHSLLHLGIGYTTRDSAEDEVRFRSRPEMHLSPERFVNTGHLAADGFDLMGLECALVYGPFSAQAEYFMNSVDMLEGDSVDFAGYYAYVSYFFTGESRPYKKGTFSRVKPGQNVVPGGGMGAWELALRYSAVDMNDGDVWGGEENNITLGLNWYLNPNTRIMWNYVSADVDEVGTVDAFMMRFQVDF